MRSAAFAAGWSPESAALPPERQDAKVQHIFCARCEMMRAVWDRIGKVWRRISVRKRRKRVRWDGFSRRSGVMRLL